MPDAKKFSERQVWHRSFTLQMTKARREDEALNTRSSTRASEFQLRKSRIIMLTLVLAVSAVCVHALDGSRGVLASGTWSVSRVSGQDRFETSAAVSKAYFPSTSSSIVLVSGINIADSIAGSAIAGKLGSPLLLTRTDSLPSSIAAEITRLRPRTVYLLGGTASITSQVESQVSGISQASVIRIWGANRMDTAIQASKTLYPTGSSTVYVTSDRIPAESLTAGALAGSEGAPILLSYTSTIYGPTYHEIVRLKPTRIVLVSGCQRFSEAFDSQLKSGLPTAERVYVGTGANPSDCSQESSGSLTSLGYSRGSLTSKNAVVVSGETMVDGLSAGAIAAITKAPLVLVKRDCMTPTPRYEMGSAGISSVVVVGGTSVVNEQAARGGVCSSTPATTLPPSTTSPPGPVNSPPLSTTQGIVYATFGCGNQIRLQAVDYGGTAIGSRVLVQSTQSVQLIPYGVSSDNNLLYGSFDCTTKSYTAYLQPINSSPFSRKILSLPSNWGLIGGTWDIARGVPALLLRDPNWTYSIQTFSSSTWTSIWSAPRTSFRGSFPAGLASRTGFEYTIWSNSTGSWSVWRLNGSGGLSEVVTGTGSINSLTSAPFERANAFITTTGTWVCDGLASGSISVLTSQRKCSAVTTSGGRYGAFTFASSSSPSYWLYLTSSGLDPNTRTRIDCPGSSVFVCQSPVVDSSQRSDIAGNNLLFMSLFGISDFNRLGLTYVP